MRVTLLNEGTYPFTPGGTSVWSDLLVSNLPQHSFDLVTVTATGRERATWPIHENVAHFEQIPLWTRRAIQTRRRQSSTADQYVANLHRAMASGDSAQPEFEEALRALASVPATEAALAFVADTTIEMVIGTWEDSDLPARVTLGDALSFSSVLQNMMRPLWFRLRPADISHAVVNGLVMLPALAAKWRAGVPVALSEHGVYLRERYLEKQNENLSGAVVHAMLRFYRMLATAGYRHSEVIAPVTEFNRRWERRVGAEETAIRTIHNGIDPARYPEIRTEPEFPTISWIGRIDPIKDLHTLIRAFLLVRAEIPDAKLRLFGPVAAGCGSYANSCRQLVKDLGLVADVSFDGPVDSSPKAFEAGHVAALSSISEGMPYTVVEAMMCGRTTVSTDVGGVAEAVGDCGIVVPPRDAEAMSLWLTHFLRDDVDRRLTGRRARERALRLFPLERSIDAYDTLYRDFGGPSEMAGNPVASSLAVAS